MKKTKIVATMSDFRCTEEFVKNLFDAGMDVVRVNSAHVSEEGATHIVETVHRVNPAIPIMIDTKGPEIRVTTIADEYGNSINFRPGDRVAVRGSDGSDKTTRKVVYMNVPNIVDDIPVGARMLIADGELEIRVVEKTAEELTCEFVVGGAMRSRKSVNVPSVSINLPSVTEKDRRFIEWAVKNDVDFIAHSFVRSAKDIKAVQDISMPTAARSRSSRRSRTARGSTTSTRSSRRRTASWWRAATWGWSCLPRRFPIPSGASSRSAFAPSAR